MRYQLRIRYLNGEERDWGDSTDDKEQALHWFDAATARVRDGTWDALWLVESRVIAEVNQTQVCINPPT